MAEWTVVDHDIMTHTCFTAPTPHGVHVRRSERELKQAR